MARTATIAAHQCKWCEAKFDGRGFHKHQESCEERHRIKHQTKHRRKRREDTSNVPVSMRSSFGLLIDLFYAAAVGE